MRGLQTSHTTCALLIYVKCTSYLREVANDICYQGLFRNKLIVCDITGNIVYIDNSKPHPSVGATEWHWGNEMKCMFVITISSKTSSFSIFLGHIKRCTNKNIT